MKEKKKVVFDDTCPFCIYSVNLLKNMDKKGKFYFEGFRDNELSFNETQIPNSILLYANHRKYSKSEAVLQLFKEMGFPYNLVYALIIIPRPIRDFIYNLVAKNRYLLLGNKP
jgi:predicted DCC family thiol-disulfide oxidoreductase YuxK